MGHLMGSPHTHACFWNGNNTAIDGCAGYTEDHGYGTCPVPGNPPNGGTIMSYCDGVPGVGVNFNNGFGPQPGELIRSRVAGAGCFSPTNKAAFVSQSVPTSMVAGQPYGVSVTMQNTGTTTWTKSALYRLGSQNPQDNGTWGVSRVELPVDSVGQGVPVTFNFTVTAPSTAGSYNFQWRMLRELVEWFGDLTPNVAVSVQPSGPPPAPSGLTAWFDILSRTMRLKWVDNSSNEQGFQVQFSYSGSAFADLSPPTVGANVTTYTSGANPPLGSYQFRVRAFASGLYSAWSNVPSLIVPAPVPASTSIAWIQPAESSWGPAGTLTAAGYASNGSGAVQLVFRERADNGVWGAWQTVPYQAPVSADGTWSNAISSGSPTNKCHYFDAYVNYSGVTSAVFQYTGWTGCP
jgi:hypothetical protein